MEKDTSGNLNGLYLVDLHGMFKQRALGEKALCQRHLGEGQGGKQVVTHRGLGLLPS